MKKYIGTKIILAEPMEDSQFQMTTGKAFPNGVEIDSTGHGKPGYRVICEDGYVSWSPKATFERAYREVTEAELILLKGAS